MNEKKEINHTAEVEALLEFIPTIHGILLAMTDTPKYIEVCNPKISSYIDDDAKDVDACITFALQKLYNPQSVILFYTLWNKLCLEIENISKHGYTTLCDVEIESHYTEKDGIFYILRLTLPLSTVKRITPLEI